MSWLRFAGFDRLILFLIFANPVVGQDFNPNYDESKVPRYSLPNPLVDEMGQPVEDAEMWIEHRRPEILDLFQAHIYGKCPEPIAVTADLISRKDDAVNGNAVRREIDLTLTRGGKSIKLGLLIYTPRGKQKVPLFLGLNFDGNHCVENDRQIRRPVTDSNAKDAASVKRPNERFPAAWPVDVIVDRGYGLATVWYADIDPDFDDNFENGIHGLFAPRSDARDQWGSIAGWAYGLSRVLDYLETDPLVDSNRVAVIGHSRLGKTALWAGASDERFKMIISNNSGCGGAALSRRAFGETVRRINSSFPHWFCKNFRNYDDREAALPVDQHQLIALIAPRPVYVASASGDLWADPKGEFLSCCHADPVYRLLGTTGMGGRAAPHGMPEADQAINDGVIGYHLRKGEHAILAADWIFFLDFADKNL
jgi:hypothetical protein